MTDIHRTAGNGMVWTRTARLALRMLLRSRARAVLAILGIAVAVFLLCAERALHAGVREITLDLKSTAGQAALHKRLLRTDVLLTSFRPSAHVPSFRGRPVSPVMVVASLSSFTSLVSTSPPPVQSMTSMIFFLPSEVT